MACKIIAHPFIDLITGTRKYVGKPECGPGLCTCCILKVHSNLDAVPIMVSVPDDDGETNGLTDFVRHYCNLDTITSVLLTALSTQDDEFGNPQDFAHWIVDGVVSFEQLISIEVGDGKCHFAYARYGPVTPAVCGDGTTPVYLSSTARVTPFYHHVCTWPVPEHERYPISGWPDGPPPIPICNLWSSCCFSRIWRSYGGPYLAYGGPVTSGVAPPEGGTDECSRIALLLPGKAGVPPGSEEGPLGGPCGWIWRGQRPDLDECDGLDCVTQPQTCSWCPTPDEIQHLFVPIGNADCHEHSFFWGPYDCNDLTAGGNCSHDCRGPHGCQICAVWRPDWINAQNTPPFVPCTPIEGASTRIPQEIYTGPRIVETQVQARCTCYFPTGVGWSVRAAVRVHFQQFSKHRTYFNSLDDWRVHCDPSRYRYGQQGCDWKNNPVSSDTLDRRRGYYLGPDLWAPEFDDVQKHKFRCPDPEPLGVPGNPETYGGVYEYAMPTDEIIVPVGNEEDCGQVAQTLLTEFTLGPIVTQEAIGTTVQFLRVKL